MSRSATSVHDSMTTINIDQPHRHRRYTEAFRGHTRWCNREEHAAYAAEIGFDDLCAGTKMTEPYEGEHFRDGRPVEISGQWRASHSVDYAGHPRFEVDPIGDLAWYGVKKLREHLTGVDDPRAVALRNLLARAWAEFDGDLGDEDL